MTLPDNESDWVWLAGVFTLTFAVIFRPSAIDTALILFVYSHVLAIREEKK